MGAYTSLATAGLNLALASQAQKEQSKELQKQRSRDVRLIKQQDALALQEQERALKQRIAQERARAGAAGVGGIGGSIDAVLKALGQESALKTAERAQRTSARVEAANDRLSSAERRNLLSFNSRWLDLGSRALSGTGTSTSTSRRSLLG